MKTGKAVMMSIAIVAAVAALAGGVGYALYREGNEPVKVETKASEPADIGAEIEDAIAGKDGAPTCGKREEHQTARAVLAPVEAALQASERPVVRIALEALKADDVKLSKVGGRAYWAAGRDYPRDARGRPLVLLAQIDLSEPPKMPGYPERGLLQFFISGDEYYGASLEAAHDGDRMQALSQPKGFRVVYWPDLAAPAVAPPAVAASDSLPFDPAKPRRMRFSADHESIGLNDAGLERVIGDGVDPLIERYSSGHPDDRRPAEDLHDDVADYLDRSGHKLGGYPDFTQSDPRQPADTRVLLLQLDSDAGLMWGDSGIANFFIDPQDLARADFSRVAYHWDCY